MIDCPIAAPNRRQRKWRARAAAEKFYRDHPQPNTNTFGGRPPALWDAFQDHWMTAEEWLRWWRRHPLKPGMWWSPNRQSMIPPMRPWVQIRQITMRVGTKRRKLP